MDEWKFNVNDNIQWTSTVLKKKCSATILERIELKGYKFYVVNIFERDGYFFGKDVCQKLFLELAAKVIE